MRSKENSTVSEATIRSAEEKDSQSIALLAEEFLPGEADYKKRLTILKKVLKNPDYKLFIAETEGEIVGFIDQWIIHDFTHGAKHSYIHNLYVSSDFRRRGIASKLLQELTKNGRNEGVTEIHVTTRVDNELAISLYKKHGFLKEHLQLEKEFK